MTAWNPRPDWLLVAVESALAQRNCEIELVLVDDGSDEPVEEVLGGIDDPRLRLVRTENRGFASARNTGVETAGGAFIRFLDADDAAEPDSTAHLLALGAGAADVIPYGAVAFCDEELSPRWTMTSAVEGDAVITCLLGRFTVRAPGMLFPRAVIERAGGWSAEFPASSDWDYVLRALEHASVRGSRTVVYRYRRHPSGITGTYLRGLEGARMAVEGYFDRHPEQRGTALHRRARARLRAHEGRVYATHGEVGRGLRHLARAATLDPTAVLVEAWQARSPVVSMARRRLAGASHANRAARPAP